MFSIIHSSTVLVLVGDADPGVDAASNKS